MKLCNFFGGECKNSELNHVVARHGEHTKKVSLEMFSPVNYTAQRFTVNSGKRVEGVVNQPVSTGHMFTP